MKVPIKFKGVDTTQTIHRAIAWKFVAGDDGKYVPQYACGAEQADGDLHAMGGEFVTCTECMGVMSALHITDRLVAAKKDAEYYAETVEDAQQIIDNVNDVMKQRDVFLKLDRERARQEWMELQALVADLRDRMDKTEVVT